MYKNPQNCGSVISLICLIQVFTSNKSIVTMSLATKWMELEPLALEYLLEVYFFADDYKLPNGKPLPMYFDCKPRRTAIRHNWITMRRLSVGLVVIPYDDFEVAMDIVINNRYEGETEAFVRKMRLGHTKRQLRDKRLPNSAEVKWKELNAKDLRELCDVYWFPEFVTLSGDVFRYDFIGSLKAHEELNEERRKKGLVVIDPEEYDFALRQCGIMDQDVRNRRLLDNFRQMETKKTESLKRKAEETLDNAKKIKKTGVVLDMWQYAHVVAYGSSNVTKLFFCYPYCDHSWHPEFKPMVPQGRPCLLKHNCHFI